MVAKDGVIQESIERVLALMRRVGGSAHQMRVTVYLNATILLSRAELREAVGLGSL
jgi:hypothetical protein